MALKWTFYYNQNQQGFTETYYSNDTDPKVAVTNLTDPQIAEFVTWRAPLTTMFAIRASDILNPRKSYLLPLYNKPRGRDVSISSVLNPDVCSTTCVVKVYSTSSRTRRIFCRGLKDSDVGRFEDGVIAPSAFLSNGIRVFFNRLASLGFCMKTVVQPPAGGLFYTNIISASQSPLGAGYTELFVPAVPAGVIAGTAVRFRRIPRNDLPGFPRETFCTSVNVGVNPSITVPYRYREPAPISTPRFQFVPNQFLLDTFQTYRIENFSEHKTGRPFGSLRGRSRAVILSR